MRRAWVKRPPDGNLAVSCCQQRGHTISLEFYMTAGLFLAPVWSCLITEGFSGWLAVAKHSRGDVGCTAAARPPGGGAGQAPWGRALGIQGPFEEGASLLGIPGPSTSRDGSMGAGHGLCNGRLSQGHVCELDVCSLASLRLWPFPAGLMHSLIQKASLNLETCV